MAEARYGLIFDNDGVLADTEGPCAEATVQMFHEVYQAEFQESDFEPYIGAGMVRYIQGPADSRGIPIDIEEAIAGFSERFMAILESGRSIALPGGCGLIDAAATNPDWVLALATSTPEKKARATMKAAGVDLQKFQVFLNGDLVSRQKPDPEIYVKAAEMLALPPHRCVVIEDSVQGVEAAKAAGMACVAVTNTFSAERLAKADHLVGSLAELSLDDLARLVDTADEPARR